MTVAGGLGEADRGGPQFNLVPKTGGNTFSGTYFGNIAGEWSQSNNVGADLKAIGIPDATKIIKAWDTSFSLGGPIVRDKLWFYATTRLFGNYTDVAGRFGNLNAGDPTNWVDAVDPSIPAIRNEPEDWRRPRHEPDHPASRRSVPSSTTRRFARAVPTRRTATVSDPR